MAGKSDTIKSTYCPKAKKLRDENFDKIDRSKPISTKGFVLRVNGKVVK